MIEPLKKLIPHTTEIKDIIDMFHFKISELVKEVNELKKTPSMPNESL